MRFRVDRDALAEAVAWVARALPSRPVVPVLSGMLIEAADGLALSCFDYDVSARVEVSAEVAEPGAALVPGRLLAEITRSLAGGQAEFEAEPDAVRLTCGAAEFTLVKLPVEEYPALPGLPAPAGTVDAADFAAAVGQVASSASRDDTLPMLTGVFAEIDGKVITLAATDRYRLAVRQLTWSPARPDLRANVLIPARTLADAARTMTSGGEVAITLRDPGDPGSREPGPRAAAGMIGFEGAGRRLTMRLLGGEFIKYASRFPAASGSRATIAPGPFIEAVRRVSLVAERGSPVRLAFGDDEVVIQAGSQGQARAVERVPAAFAGDERVIAFSPQYLLDGLVAASTVATPRAGQPAAEPAAEAASDRGSAAGRIGLEFTSAARPAVISWVRREEDGPGDDPGPPDFRYLVVPLRMPGGD